MLRHSSWGALGRMDEVWEVPGPHSPVDGVGWCPGAQRFWDVSCHRVLGWAAALHEEAWDSGHGPGSFLCSTTHLSFAQHPSGV